MKLFLRTGDQAIFDTAFGPALVIAPPGVITGTSRIDLEGLCACIEGDESSVGVMASYSIPGTSLTGGTGILTIEGLAADQTSRTASSTRTPLLREGTRFRARLQVVVPAFLTDSVDTQPVHYGGGHFATSNSRAHDR